MRTIIKVFTIQFLPSCGNREDPDNFQNKSVISSFTWVSRYILFLAKLKRRKGLFGGCNKGGCIVRLPPRVFGCHKKRKSLTFCEIWNNPTPPLLLFRLPYEWAPKDMEFYDKFMDRFQSLSKVQDLAVNKAKV